MDLDWLSLLPLPWPLVGVAGILAGAAPLVLRIRRAEIRLVGVVAIMLGFGLISPWFLLLSVPPAVIVVNRRRRRLRNQGFLGAEVGAAAAEQADWRGAYETAGFRYAGTVHVKLADGSFPVAVHRLPDLCGWIEMTPTSVEIQHQFDGHHLSTVDFRALPRPRRHLLQLCVAPDFDTRLAAHRRLLARLAHMGRRPDRLSDDEVLGILLRQIETAFDEVEAASWRDALVLTYWEERAAQDQLGCEPLADDPQCERKLAAWLTE